MTQLSVDGLRTIFNTQSGTVTAVEDVSFSLERGETLGIVGESGSGKSVTARSIMRLIRDPGEIVAGKIRYDGTNLLEIPDGEMRGLRGDDLSMIFQEPGEALNPSYTVGEQIVEALRVHGYDAGDPMEKARELLKLVGIPSPEENVSKYPHQYSGGMAQRAMIAIAIANDPSILIADEPTTGLDVTIEAQVLDLLNEIQAEMGMSMLFISHDLGVIWEMCDRVAVMYMGRIVEMGETDELFENPKHPYTQGLIDCLPGAEGSVQPIDGSVPSALDIPQGCSFHPRCPHASPACREAFPETAELDSGSAACYLHTDRSERGDRKDPASLPVREPGESASDATSENTEVNK